MQVRNYRVTVASARVVALGMQNSRFYRKLGCGNIKTCYEQVGKRRQRKWAPQLAAARSQKSWLQKGNFPFLVL